MFKIVSLELQGISKFPLSFWLLTRAFGHTVLRETAFLDLKFREDENHYNGNGFPRGVLSGGEKLGRFWHLLQRLRKHTTTQRNSHPIQNLTKYKINTRGFQISTFGEFPSDKRWWLLMFWWPSRCQNRPPFLPPERALQKASLTSEIQGVRLIETSNTRTIYGKRELAGLTP